MKLLVVSPGSLHMNMNIENIFCVHRVIWNVQGKFYWPHVGNFYLFQIKWEKKNPKYMIKPLKIGLYLCFS